jgi:hypothetical protein
LKLQYPRSGDSPPLRARITERQKTKQASLHRSPILKDLRAMQAQAAEFFAYAGKFRCIWRLSFADSLFRFLYFKTRS